MSRPPIKTKAFAAHGDFTKLPPIRKPWPVEPRPFACVTCGRSVVIASVTEPDPGAPEFLQPPPGAWIALVMGDHNPEMVVTCSATCTQHVLRAAERP